MHKIMYCRTVDTYECHGSHDAIYKYEVSPIYNRSEKILLTLHELKF